MQINSTEDPATDGIPIGLQMQMDVLPKDGAFNQDDTGHLYTFQIEDHTSQAADNTGLQ